MENKDYGLQHVMPSDEKAEMNVLGTIINHDELFTQVEDILDVNAFYSKRNRCFYRIIKYIIKSNHVIDESSIIACYEKFSNRLDVSLDEIQYAIMEAGVSDSPRTFMQDVERIIDYGVRRRAWETLQKMSADVVSLTENTDDTIAKAISELDKVRGSMNADSGIVDASQALKMVNEQINDNLAGINKGSVKTGFRFSDEKGGLRFGSLVVIGAFTSVGKSTLAMNISVNAAKKGTPVAYYSLEMSVNELWARVINQHTRVPAWKITSYALNRDELRLVDEAMNSLRNLPIYIDDNATTKFEKMLRSVRTMVKKYGIKMFVVDYLQIFAQGSKNEREESVLSYMARELKNICRELNIVCIALSQLRRAGEDKHPTIDMLRGSGQIEESADNIVLLDRPDAHPEWGVTRFKGCELDVHGKAEIRVSKGRNIGTGVYYVDFDGERFLFQEPDNYDSYETISDSVADGQPNNPVKTEQEMPF